MITRAALLREKRRAAREEVKSDIRTKKRAWHALSDKLKSAAREGKDYAIVCEQDIALLENALKKRHFLIVHLESWNGGYGKVIVYWGAEKNSAALFQLYLNHEL